MNSTDNTGSAAGCVWVTGAGSGIGRAVALGFAGLGRAVALSGRNMETLSEVAEEIRLSDGTALAARCDVADSDSVASAHAAIVDALGPVDVLVNNAGVTVFNAFQQTTVEQFDDLTATNLRGPYLCSKAVIDGMVERGTGTIAMINSMASKLVFDSSSVYSMTKAGLRMMADCLRHEVRGSGVRVISVFPGATNTDIWPGKVREKHGHRMMRAEDVADALIHACSMPGGVLVEDLYLQPTGGAL